MIPIMNGPSVPFTMLIANTPARASAWFRKALVALWDAGIADGVDPAVLAGQCAHETGWGNFGGAVTPDMGNTCGLKIRNPHGDRKEDHADFGLSPDGYPIIGAFAHADHLRLYAGFPVDPRTTNDPRAVYIQPGTPNFGRAAFVRDLGGLWAPSKTYGEMVEAKIEILRGRVE
jgi:hypothetical protein